MFAEQGNNRNRVKKLCFYSVLTATAIIFGFVESLIPLSFIAPGIKLGLANSVALICLVAKDIKGAFLVNISRILLSALLFGSPFSLLFSICAGMASLLVCSLLIRFDSFSIIGISIAGAVVHNIVQTVVAIFVIGVGVFYYLPFLIISAVVSGAVIGIIVMIVSKKMKKITRFFG